MSSPSRRRPPFLPGDWLKHDAGRCSRLLGVLALVAARALDLAGRRASAFRVRSLAFRFDWGRAPAAVVRWVAGCVVSGSGGDERVVEPLRQVLVSAVDSLQPLPHTAKFFDDPRELFEGIMIVLASPTRARRGVVLVKYSYYFLLLERCFDIAALQRDYWLVVEPSWNGYCDESILCFLRYPEPVFVLTPEPHDRRLLEALGGHLVIVPTGPNAFVDHRLFVPDPTARPRYDLAMIAGWSRFKRHAHVFSALARLRERGRIVRAVLLGYAGDSSLESVKRLAEGFGIAGQLELHDTLPPEKVVEALQRSRCNILWSRFEGSPRVVTEGLFCDVPCIVREGLNYGEPYHYVNERTGRFANDRDLPQAILSVLDAPQGRFAPRDYMLEHMTYAHATDLIERTIDGVARERGMGACPRIASKVNFLHGMRYAEPGDRHRFAGDYRRLAGYLLTRNA